MTKVTHFSMTHSLAKLPLDIFVILTTHLYNVHFSAFISLRSACRNFRKNSNELFFRKITIKGGHEEEAEILKRLKVSDGTVAGMVHCIRFAPSTQKPVVAENLIATLSESWKCFVNLRKIM